MSAPVVEILHVRDPDGSCSLDVWVDGAPATQVREVTVDAGAGHDCHDWDETRRDATGPGSAAFRAAADEAFSDPPGADYIDHSICEH